MAEFTHNDLRKLRESRKWPRWKLAAEIGMSEDALERIENGKQPPHPDDVGLIERALDAGAEMVWCRWMHSNCDSYREHHPEVSSRPEQLSAIVRVRYELDDVMALQAKIERKIASGDSDLELLAEYRKESTEAMAALTEALAQIPKS